MPTVKASRNTILSIVTGLQSMDPADEALSITWVHGVARNVKLAASLTAEWKAKTDVINSEAYVKYQDAKQALGDGADTTKLDEEYKEVLADRQALVEAADKWLAEEIDHEIYAWPLSAVPAVIDRRFLVAITDWIRD